MFSDRGRTLEQKTLEYAWMLEIQIGKLSGKLTSPQVSTFSDLNVVIQRRNSGWVLG